jgi:hypothetical protein
MHMLRRVVSSIGLLLAGVIYLGWQWAHRGVSTYGASVFPYSDADEWRYISCSRLVLHGYALFTQVFSAQPPLLFVSLASGMRLFGDSVTGAHLTEASFGLVGLAAACVLAYLLAGELAAAATGLLLAVSPLYLVYSRAVEAEGPMMAMMTVGIALAVGYWRRGGRTLIVLAGLAIAAAILFKLFAVAALVPAGWAVLLRPASMRDRLLSLVLLGIAAALPVALEMALLAPGAQWDQVMRLHEQAGAIVLPGADSTLSLFRYFVHATLGLSAMAALGVCVLAARRRLPELSVLAVWLATFIVMLVAFHPLFQHHLAILLTGVGVAAGCGVGEAWTSLTERQWTAPACVGLAAVIFLFAAPGMIHEDRHTVGPLSPSGSTLLAAYLTTHTGPGDMIATDDSEAAVLAGRLVPPALCDPSTVRYLAGYMPAADVIAQTAHYHAQVAAPRATFALEGAYVRWLDRHYRKMSLDGAPLYTRR